MKDGRLWLTPPAHGICESAKGANVSSLNCPNLRLYILPCISGKSVYCFHLHLHLKPG